MHEKVMKFSGELTKDVLGDDCPVDSDAESTLGNFKQF
jgi:hypothetical protein